MGLLEKRAVKDFQDNLYPSIVTQINTIAGFDLEIEVQWETIAIVEYSHMYEEGFTKVFFTPIIEALKEITSDDLGKEALKETLKKIIITNKNDNYSVPRAFSFSDNILTIDHQPFTNMDNVEERISELITFLMSQM